MKIENLLRLYFVKLIHLVFFLLSFFKVQQLSKKEVEDLLRKGAYGALMDEEDEGSKFCEEDIDQILQRRTQTITIESEGKGSTFAKVMIFAKAETHPSMLLFNYKYICFLPFHPALKIVPKE